MLVIAWKRRLQFSKRQQILFKSSGFLLSTSSSSSSPPSSCSHSILVFSIQWVAVHFLCIFFLENVAILLCLRHNRKVISVWRRKHSTSSASLSPQPLRLHKTTAQFNRKQFLSIGNCCYASPNQSE